MDRTRASAVAALLITAFAVVYAGGSAVTGWEPRLGWLLQTVIHLGELAAVAALAFSSARARGRAGRVGLAAAAAGQLAIAAAEVVWPHDPDVGDVLFAVSPLLTGAGLVVAGVVIARAGAWTGVARWLPLALGLYTLLVLIPAMVGSGGPPAPLALWVIAGWDLLWLLVAAAVLARSRMEGAAPAGRSGSARVTVR
ncbi:hypothetical protein ACQP00_45810 [Dactylosporangium sp. CS-047395]|uniref:hypothetical protein n=1 Tax=Dactylosporangium sp. CS-047395 TaxID=3239936 RepID=UPI003D8B2878